MTQYRIFHEQTHKYVQPRRSDSDLRVTCATRHLALDDLDENNCETLFELTPGKLGPIRHVESGQYVVRDENDDLILCDEVQRSLFKYQQNGTSGRFKSKEPAKGYWYVDSECARCHVTVRSSETFTFTLETVNRERTA